jgi:glycosyltransferase involved in cell wall biosynthesis
MRVGISGLALGNPTGLGRLSRTYILALAQAAPDWELHAYLRRRADLDALREECGQRELACIERLHVHLPRGLARAAVPGCQRLVQEHRDLPAQFLPLHLDAYLGCDFTLPQLAVAPHELVLIPDLLPFTHPATVAWRARWLYRSGIRRSLRRQAALLCISQHTAQQLSRLFPSAAANLRVVYPALSPRLLHLAQQTPHGDYAPQVLGSLNHLRNPGRYILAVGTLGPRKNTALLVELYRQLVLAGRYRGSLVLVGGDGSHHSQPPGQLLALQHAGVQPPAPSRTAEIYDLGRVSDFDLSQLYRGADLLVNLSVEEGFGFPVLEALAHGTPALVTAGGSMAEISALGSAATSLDEATCREALASALKAVPILRREAMAFDISRFTIERLGAELRQIIEGGPPCSSNTK